MSIIAIARASYSHGKKIAEKVAQELNYECISEEVISLASQEFDIPENWLRQAVENAPTLRDRFSYGKKKYIAYIRSALLEFAARDNVVYHALAGHFLLEGIPNILKVMISATVEERVKETMQRADISKKEALKSIEKFDKDRKKWAMYFHSKDPWDLSMYDLGIVIGSLTIDDAVDKILTTVKLPSFQTSTEMLRILRDESLAAKVKSDLMNFYADVEVSAEDGAVIVHIKRSLQQEEALTDDIRGILLEMPGVKDVQVDVIPVY
ncbi:MAG: cytidylate kinase-like family protein [Desulfatiglandaceae bacterium]|jgi:cytidylate kinase